MSELHDRVDAIKKQQAERAREEHERSLGQPIRKPTKEEALLIREFLQNYKGPWQIARVWAPESAERVWSGIGDKKYRRRNNIREVECVYVFHPGNWDDGNTLILCIFRDGRVSGQPSHEDLVDQLARLLA